MRVIDADKFIGDLLRIRELWSNSKEDTYNTTSACVTIISELIGAVEGAATQVVDIEE